MTNKYIKISVKDVCVYPSFVKEDAISKDGKSYIKSVEQVIDESNAIQSHCVANMLTTFLGLRPVKNNQNSVCYGEGNSFSAVRNSIDKKLSWVSSLADECLYSIDSTIIKEVQTGHKPYYTRNKGIPNMRWIDALNMLNGDRCKFLQLLMKLEELTGVKIDTTKIDFETYADRYIRGKVDYKTALLDKEWNASVFDSRNSFTFLVNQLDKKRGFNDMHTGYSGNCELFDGKYVSNDIVNSPVYHYTFDVSFYIPVDKAEELLNANRKTVNAEGSFADIVRQKLSAFYLGSSAVFKSDNTYLDDVNFYSVKDGSLHD